MYSNPTMPMSMVKKIHEYSVELHPPSTAPQKCCFIDSFN